MEVQSLDQEEPLEEQMATHSSILAWRSPRIEDPGRIQSMRSQRVGYNRVTKHGLSEDLLNSYPGESHGLSSLVGYSPWGCKESDTTEHLHFHPLEGQSDLPAACLGGFGKIPPG